MKLAKVRQDAWSHEDDLLLAETVLRNIREGGTQLNAFEEVGDELNRTSAACGFRWNAEVRNKYIHAIDIAKRQRKENKRAQASQEQVYHKPLTTFSIPAEQESSLIMEQESITLDGVITFLQSIKGKFLDTNRSKDVISNYQKENNHLQQETKRLERELMLSKKKLVTIEEDYKTFIQIMDRARKMSVLEEQSTAQTPAFKMDKNGNLEQLI